MSNINPNNIDGTFPIAGQDNSSQGFRDNFTNIRNNFSYAQSEISDLQSKALTTSALSGGSLINDMAYNQIYRALLASPSYSFATPITPTNSAPVTLDYIQGTLQKITTAGSQSSNGISFANWPSSGFGEMILWVTVTSQFDKISFTDTMVGFGEIAGANISTKTITFDYPGDYLLQFKNFGSPINQIVISDISRNFSTLRDPNLYWNDAITPTLLVGYNQTTYGFQTALSLEYGQDRVSSLGSYNSVAWGNIFTANISSPVFDTGIMGGYTVTGTRGNLQSGSTPSAVSNNDFLGYVNSVTYTGSPTQVNSFQQVAGIGFYATGSNALGGLGGNIGFFTHTPVTTGNVLTQAVGIENDQSVKFFGNVVRSAGFVDQGYQYSAPTTSFWTIITPGKSRMIFDPTGTIAQGNITLPNCTVDGTIVSIHSTQTITVFGANTQQAGTTIVPSFFGPLSSGTGIEYFYHATENKWYKIR